MERRVSLLDVELVWAALDATSRDGRGGLESAASQFGVHRSFVTDAVGRVEAAMGGVDFFARRVRRLGKLTAAGKAFHREAPKLVLAWRTLSEAVSA